MGRSVTNLLADAGVRKPAAAPRPRQSLGVHAHLRGNLAFSKDFWQVCDHFASRLPQERGDQRT
jgi:hypothetical protein